MRLSMPASGFSPAEYSAAIRGAQKLWWPLLSLRMLRIAKARQSSLQCSWRKTQSAINGRSIHDAEDLHESNIAEAKWLSNFICLNTSPMRCCFEILRPLYGWQSECAKWKVLVGALNNKNFIINKNKTFLRVVLKSNMSCNREFWIINEWFSPRSSIML